MNQLLLFFKNLVRGYVCPRAVGIEFSSTAIKLIELENNSFKIAKYLINEYDKDFINNNKILSLEMMAQKLNQAWQMIKPCSVNMVLALNPNDVVIKNITLKSNKKNLIDEQIKLYLKNNFTEQLDQLSYDYAPYPKSINNSNPKNNYLLTVCKQEIIKNYQTIAHLNKLKISAINVEIFVLQNMFESLNQQQNLSYIPYLLVLDIGLTKIKSYIFIDNKCINYEILNYHLAPNCDFLITALIGEIKKIIQLGLTNLLVQQKINIIKFDRIIIAGGVAHSANLKNELERLYNCKSMEFAQWIKQYNPQINNLILNRLMLAYGLSFWQQDFA